MRPFRHFLSVLVCRLSSPELSVPVVWLSVFHQVFKLNTQEVIDFHATQGAVRIPGVPDLDPARLVDGDRTIQILKPLPVTSQGRDFEFRSRVLGVYDKGKGGATVLDMEDVLVDAASGDVYARNIGCLFYVGQGGWGGPRGPARARKFPPPEGKAPDLVFELQVDDQAAHLYRYVGALNPTPLPPPRLSRAHAAEVVEVEGTLGFTTNG